LVLLDYALKRDAGDFTHRPAALASVLLDALA